MIKFDFQTPCPVIPSINHKQWLKAVIRKENLIPGNIDYLYCDDEYLLKNNIHFLNHDTLTDIITFDDRVGDVVSGNIMISLDRIKENAEQFNASFEDEFLRVTVHGVLHICGYKDKSDADAAVMRQKENESIALFHELFYK